MISVTPAIVWKTSNHDSLERAGTILAIVTIDIPQVNQFDNFIVSLHFETALERIAFAELKAVSSQSQTLY